MFGHFPELVIILVIGLIVFGPEKLPEVAGSAGKVVGELRRAMNEVMNPEDTRIPDDFSTYYYESLRRNGEEPQTMEVEPGETWHMSTVEVDEEEQVAGLEEPLNGTETELHGAVPDLHARSEGEGPAD